MKRIDIHVDRVDYDGKKRSWAAMEREHRSFKKGIYNRLDKKIKDEKAKPDPDKKKLAFWRLCRTNTYRWLTAKPAELSVERAKVDKYRRLLDDAAFCEEVKKVYGYDHSKLKRYARWLNIKTCPYCNMQYTLYAEAYTEKGELEKMAEFQFDHFYPQSKYPMFGMSMYNLIPSCASCNLSKKEEILELTYHPYVAAIGDAFHFRVDNPIRFFMGSKTDVPKIEVVPEDGYDVSKYNEKFHIQALYQQHADVAQEVFARAYANEKYYGNNRHFGFVGNKQFEERLYKGFYPDKEDIEKRPLTKFMQDMWEQATGDHRWWKAVEKVNSEK